MGSQRGGGEGFREQEGTAPLTSESREGIQLRTEDVPVGEIVQALSARRALLLLSRGASGPEREEGASWGWREGLGSLAGPRSSLWMGVGSSSCRRVPSGGNAGAGLGPWAPQPPPASSPASLEPGALPSCGLTPREAQRWRGPSVLQHPRWARSVPISEVRNAPSQGHFVTVTPPGS